MTRLTPMQQRAKALQTAKQAKRRTIDWSEYQLGELADVNQSTVRRARMKLQALSGGEDQ